MKYTHKVTVEWFTKNPIQQTLLMTGLTRKCKEWMKKHDILYGIVPKKDRLVLTILCHKEFAEEQIQSLLGEMSEAYKKDRGLSLVKAAFAEQFRHEIVAVAYDRVDFAEVCRQAGGLDNCRIAVEADAKDLDSLYALGCCYAADARYEEALKSLLSVVSRQRDRGRDRAKEAMVAIFEIIGQRSTLADEYRDKLQRMLY